MAEITDRSGNRMPTFLFSVDLEEFYAADPARVFRCAPLPELAEIYLEFLRRHKMKATFFVVGEVARKFPATLESIRAEGHELGCHTDAHRPLDEYTPASLRDDLARNLEALRGGGAENVKGFRAPVLSLTEKTQWAYEVLAGLGFEYSSSVLPARNPLHGWPGFTNKPRRMAGLLELPVTLARVGVLEVPIGAGTYFRCLPYGLIKRRFDALAAGGIPILGYFHPYDVDVRQERVLHRGVRGNRFLNALLYVNRAGTIERLESLVAAGFNIMTYAEYVSHQYPCPA